METYAGEAHRPVSLLLNTRALPRQSANSFSAVLNSEENLLSL